MKSRRLWIGIILMVVVSLTALAGCSGGQVSAGSSGETAAASEQATASGLLNENYENALPVQLQLVVGILKLDGTENEVDAKMSQELLPLWKAVRSLSSSDTTAPEELQALYRQIQETLTPAQLQAIADMKLTRDSMADVAQQMGLNFGPAGRSLQDLTPEQRATIEARRASGEGFPGGGPPPDLPQGGGQQGGGVIAGGGPQGGIGPGFERSQGAGNSASGSSAESTRQAGRAQNGAGFGSMFYDAIISYLEGKLD